MALAAQLALFPEPTAIASSETSAPLLAPVRVQSGDLWQLGRHRLLCGDATCADDVARLMWGVKVGACITDPPYGIAHKIDYSHISGGVGYGHLRRNWGQHLASDTKPFDPTPLLRFRTLVLWGANFYAGKLPIGTWLAWDKRLPDGRALWADAELAWMRGGKGVYIFAHMWQGFTRANKRYEPNLHPTQKPIALMEWCMEKAKAGQRVFDPYCGSGPVLIACERTGRTCYGIEIEPHYCDITLRRWEQATGQTAILLDRASS